MSDESQFLIDIFYVSITHHYYDLTILVRRSKSFCMSHIVGNLIEEIKTFDERYISIITPI